MLKLLKYKTIIKPRINIINIRKNYSIKNEKETLLKLLSNIGSRREIEYYLNRFTSVDSKEFAIIKVGGGVIEKDLDILTSGLSFLQKVGLYPIVVHGAGPQLNLLLENSKIPIKYENGIRITDELTLDIVRKVFLQENLKLVNALEKLGTRAQPIMSGVFLAEYLDKNKYGYVGEIIKINKTIIESCLLSGSLPILTSLAETSKGQILNVNADVAASALAKELKPLKVIYLNEKGGLYNEATKKKIKEINLDKEYKELMNEEWVKYGTKLKLIQIKEILDCLPNNSSISIISANNLYQELFTSSGTGTLIRKGIQIKYTENSKEIDIDLVKKLLKKNTNDENELPDIQNGIFYFDENYNLFIKIKKLSFKNFEGYYIERFIKNKEVIFNSILENTFKEMKQRFKNLIWVVNQNDLDLDWYFDRADGSLNLNNKVLFWVGTTKLEEIEQLLKYFQNGNTSININNKRSHSTATTCFRDAKRYFSTNFVSNKNSNRAINVGLVGARGHTGSELIRLINEHPNFRLKHIGSRELAGQRVDEYNKKDLNYELISPDNIKDFTDVEAWILALPNLKSKSFVSSIELTDTKVLLDLSADHRFDKLWWYGLSELFPLEKTEANKHPMLKIANPGCYATAAQLGLFPLMSNLQKFASLDRVHISIFGVSGYSGAGTAPSDKNDVKILENNLIPYSLVEHIHEKEIGRHLNCKVYFVPHVASFFRGISMTIIISSDKAFSNLGIGHTEINSDGLCSLYQQFYMNYPLIKIQKSIPLVKDNQNMHFASIGGFSYDSKLNKIVINVTLDNLLKGAATQAIQNLNEAFELQNITGIPLY